MTKYPPLRFVRFLVLCIATGGVAVVLSGCAALSAQGDQALIKASLDGLTAAVVSWENQQQAGGDINEPVTGWILAIGSAVLPVSAVISWALAWYYGYKRNRAIRLNGTDAAAK